MLELHFRMLNYTVHAMTGPVRSVSQAFAILRLLAARPRGMTLSDVARAAQLSPSSCLNLLRTLVGEGAIERGHADRRYRLVAGWTATGSEPSGLKRLIDRFALPARDFAERHECTVGLWQAVSPERFSLVALGESEAATRIHMVIGQRQPIGGGSIGRAIAARDGIGDEELRRRFGQVRWQQPLSFETYAAQVGRAARLGFAVDDGYGHAGICSLGAVVAAIGGAGLCISASIFARSRDAAAVEAIGRDLVALANGPTFGT